MPKVTAHISRTALVKINLTEPLNDDTFTELQPKLEALPGVVAAWLGENGHQVGLDLATNFTGVKAARKVAAAAATCLGVKIKGEVPVGSL